MDQRSEKEIDVDDGTVENDILTFAQHYSGFGHSVREILSEIMDDMSSYSNLHNWDDRPIISPIWSLKKACREYMELDSGRLDSLLAFVHVVEVLTHRNENHVYPAMAHPIDVERHLFFLREPLKEKDLPISVPSPVLEAGKLTSVHGLRGRVVYIDGKMPHRQRAVLLLLQAFCIRLQMEDLGFINSFMNLHSEVRHITKMPRQWQEISGPELNSERQRTFKRVTVSCHITYLTMVNSESSIDAKDVFDRRSIFFSHLTKGCKESYDLRLYKSSSSTLLTIAIPEHSTSRKEEVDLLRNPKGLWNILVVNSPFRFASDQEPPAYLTPITQYVRGITSTLVIQRHTAETIFDTLRDRVQASEAINLFDDEKFTKSNLFHSTVQHCDELRNSLAVSLRFMRRNLNTHLKELCEQAHESEKIGIDHWVHELEEEMCRIEDLQDQLQALNAQVRESRNALHSVTAVLQAREALQQGERLKALAYLATLYLPLTAAASLYSMSVLPSSATFYSFFIVFVGLIFVTVFTGMFVSSIVEVMKSASRRSLKSIKSCLGQTKLRTFGLTLLAYYQGTILKLLDPSVELKLSKTDETKLLDTLVCFYIPYRALRFLSRRLPAMIIHDCLVPAIILPGRLWMMWQLRGSRFVRFSWNPSAFVIDGFCLAFWPVATVSLVGLLAYIILLDFLVWAVRMVFWSVRCRTS